MPYRVKLQRRPPMPRMPRPKKPHQGIHKTSSVSPLVRTPRGLSKAPPVIHVPMDFMKKLLKKVR